MTKSSSSIYTRMTKDDLFRMGYLHQVAGDLPAAAECYLRSIERSPSAEAHTFLGWVLGQMGEFEQAIEECKKALKLDPDFGNAWNDIGAYLMEKHEFNKAIPYFKKACKAKNYDSPAYPHYNLGRVYAHKGMLLSAVRELDLAVKFNSNFVAAKRLLETLQYQIH